MEGEKPQMAFSAGAVRAAVWTNTITKDGREIEVYSIRIDRTYKQGEEFKSTSSFNLNDLPKVQLVAAKAFEALSLKQVAKEKA